MSRSSWQTMSHTGMAVTSDGFLQMYTYKQKNTFQIKINITVVPDDKGWLFFFFFYSPLLDLGEFWILSILKTCILTAKQTLTYCFGCFGGVYLWVFCLFNVFFQYLVVNTPLECK